MQDCNASKIQRTWGSLISGVGRFGMRSLMRLVRVEEVLIIFSGFGMEYSNLLREMAKLITLALEL